ncbi:ROK family glucokinase [Microlunatus elymi]|uniref:Glucokinase n=1 Tax=Microlunatus elymi TaxID=2596828 RepID=A0A516Q2L9_9ACTN|nr:ROK family glucokinase [Microlunatus elymi]QDP97632.1 ROK family glucokinase [Microlunatus elymi]
MARAARAPRATTRAARSPAKALPTAAVPYSIGVDIGGTKVAAGVVNGQGEIVERELAATPSRSAVAVEDTIAEVVRKLRHRHRVETVGIGAAGWVDTDQAVVRFSPHLAWRQEPLKQRLEQRIDLPLIVDNDANAAAWAEYRYGAGKGASVMVCITLGTGIGGGLVLNGQLFRGSYGMAGEWGHMIAVPGGQLCECGNRGCWEQYASGNALVRDAKELVRSGSPVVQGLLDAVGGPDQITGPAITDAAVNGEPLARELLADIGRWLGVGIANLAAALDPELVVVGGGVSAAGDLLLIPTKESFQRTLTGRGFRPQARIELATFRNDAGLIGAADLARHSLIEPPGRVIGGFWPRRRRGVKRARPRRERREAGTTLRQAAAKRVQRRPD